MWGLQFNGPGLWTMGLASAESIPEDCQGQRIMMIIKVLSQLCRVSYKNFYWVDSFTWAVTYLTQPSFTWAWYWQYKLTNLWWWWIWFFTTQVQHGAYFFGWDSVMSPSVASLYFHLLAFEAHVLVHCFVRVDLFSICRIEGWSLRCCQLQLR